MGVCVEENRTSDLLALRLAFPSAPPDEGVSHWGLTDLKQIDEVSHKEMNEANEVGGFSRLGRRSWKSIDRDEEGMARKKLRLSKEQSMYLESTFTAHHTLNMDQKLALAEKLNLRPRQIEVWFQNRRARTKAKQTEVDFEFLKRYCATLKEENRKLTKELQVLKALDLQELATHCLKFCPSCKRFLPTYNVQRPTPFNLAKPQDP